MIFDINQGQDLDQTQAKAKILIYNLQLMPFDRQHLIDNSQQ